VDKARIQAGLSLRLTDQPAQQIVRGEVNLDSHAGGAMVCPRQFDLEGPVRLVGVVPR